MGRCANGSAPVPTSGRTQRKRTRTLRPDSGHPAGYFRRLPHPARELVFVEPIFTHIVVTHVFHLAGARRKRLQRGTLEERHANEVGEHVEGSEPTLPL